MNWVEKHLNWTAVIILPLSIILGFMLGYIYLYITGRDSYNVLFPGEFGFLATAILLTTGTSWIISKKNLSPATSLYFIPLLLLAIIARMMTIQYPAVTIAAIYTSLLWIIGWTELIAATIQPLPHPNSRSFDKFTRKIKSPLKWACTPFQNHPRVTVVTFFTAILIIITLGIISGNSYVSRFNNYIIHSTQVKSPSSNMTFTFECPDCLFSQPVSPRNEVYPDHAVIWLSRGKRTWFSASLGVSLWVYVTSPKDFHFSSDMSITEKASTYLFEKVVERKTIAVRDTRQISIAGIPAYYVRLSMDKDSEVVNRNIYTFVSFEHNGLVWVISMEDKSSQNLKYFDHLLETFKITED